jgi:hypothetical protein
VTIRPYQPGDELAQVEIYNASAAALPAFKPATVDEVERRYRTTDRDPGAKFYAVEGGEVVGYAVFNPNGRISFPWCRSGAEALRGPLLEAVLEAMRQRGHSEAWLAYRGDWEPVLSFFRTQGFAPARTMINYIAGVADLTDPPVPAGAVIRPLERADLPRLVALGRGLFRGVEVQAMESFYFANPFFAAADLFALAPEAEPAELLGAALLVSNPGYADPGKIDAAMPCFRLGVFGTESQRHKRVNGLYSCVWDTEPAAATLLAEAARRLERLGLSHVAAQVPSDRPDQVAFFDRHFHRQGAFPVLSRGLSRVE